MYRRNPINPTNHRINQPQLVDLDRQQAEDDMIWVNHSFSWEGGYNKSPSRSFVTWKVKYGTQLSACYMDGIKNIQKAP